MTRAEASAIYARGKGATITALLAQTSQTTLLPPSSDPPGTPRSHRPPSGRRPGGQPGHPGHSRPLLPVDQVQAVVPVKPPRFHRCGRRLSSSDPAPQRHQVTEVPPGVPAESFGLRLQALAAVCTGVYHLSRRTTVGLLHDLCGVELALGSVTACEAAASQAMAAPWRRRTPSCSSSRRPMCTRPAGARGGAGPRGGSPRGVTPARFCPWLSAHSQGRNQERSLLA